MTSRQMVDLTVTLEHKHLDNGYKKHIIEKIRRELKNKCTNSQGYVIEVYDLKEIANIRISPATSLPTINVTVEVEFLLPVQGKEFEGTVCMVYSDGIFVNIFEDKFQVLVPKNQMDTPIFCVDNTSMKVNGNEIKEGDTISVRLASITYTPEGNFSSYGSIV